MLLDLGGEGGPECLGRYFGWCKAYCYDVRSDNLLRWLCLTGDRPSAILLFELSQDVRSL